MNKPDPRPVPEAVHNQMAHQFELHIDGGLCLLQYRVVDGRMIIYHTEVPENLEGRGLAAHLTRIALAFAKTEKLRVEARCPYTAAFFQKNPEYRDLLA